MSWEETSFESAVTLAVLNTHIKIRMALERPMRMMRKKLLIHMLKDGGCVRVSKTDAGRVQIELLDNVRHTYSGRYVLAEKPIAGPSGFYKMRFVSDRLEDETPTGNHREKPTQMRAARRHRTQKNQ